jgi:hypothetical protein
MRDTKRGIKTTIEKVVQPAEQTNNLKYSTKTTQEWGIQTVLLAMFGYRLD